MAGRKGPKRQRAKTRTATKRPRSGASRRAKPARRAGKKRSAGRRTRPAKATARRKAPRRAKRPVRRAKPAATSRPRSAPVARSPHAAAPATLGRQRRTLSDTERLGAAGAAGGFRDDRLLSAARAGHDELKSNLNKHTETSPALAGGDIDAKWEDAYAVGDEAPGGDNPTPGQDRVEEIGKALGVNYQEGQELEGGDEIAERDKHRWELDPASSDDWPHEPRSKK